MEDLGIALLGFGAAVVAVIIGNALSKDRYARCPEVLTEDDGKWRCGKRRRHPGIHQAYKRGQWWAIWWGDSDELDHHFGIPS